MRATPQESSARQEALYNFLLSRGDNWTSLRQVTDSINLYPTFFTGSYHNSGARRLCTGDIEAINTSKRYDKIIVSGARGVKIANKKDLDRFLSAEWKEVNRKITRIRNLAKKGTADQQMDLEGKITEAFLNG